MDPPWIIIPVHNRMAHTRACLENLRSQSVFDWCTVCVVDDGCTDGTSAMLESEFPEVRVLRGDGYLFWGGAIALGMEAAFAAGAQVVVWLNDDCRPDPGSIDVVIRRVHESHGMCGGVCLDPDDPSVVTYSGATRTFLGRLNARLLRPEPGEFLPVDVINGNLVAVHRDLVAAIGPFPAGRFRHYGGDSVYCLRTRRAGKTAELAGSATARSRRDDPLGQFGRTKPVLALWREPFRVGSPLNLRANWFLLREAYGAWAWFRWPGYVWRLLRLTAVAGLRRRPAANATSCR